MIAELDGDVFDQHAIEASFLWSARDAAARDPGYDLASLAEVDDRLDAHLDGLRLAGDDGWATAFAKVDEDGGPGSLFTAAVLALSRRDLRGIAAILDASGGREALSRGIVSAFGWVPFASFRGILPGLLSHRAGAELHYLGIAGCAAHRRDPGAALGYAVMSREPRLRARALRAAGELGRADLLNELRAALSDEDERCRFWAAWSLAIAGDQAAVQPLWGFATRGGPFAERACSMVMRCLAPGVAYTWLYSMSNVPGAERAAIEGAMSLGDPSVIPWLLDLMASPATARRAGLAFQTITGVDLAASDLRAPAPEGFESGPNDDPEDEDVAMDPDETLAWPDAARIGAFWRANAKRYKRGTRHLLGEPLSAEHLHHVLRVGGQAARAAAAIELAMRKARNVVFEVRAPSSRQLQEM